MTDAQIRYKNRMEIDEATGFSYYGHGDIIADSMALVRVGKKSITDNVLEMYVKVNKQFGIVLKTKICFYDSNLKECITFN